MKVRAKFRCNGINFSQTSRANPEVLAAASDEEKNNYLKLRELAEKMDLPVNISHDQPTVILNPVTPDVDASEEDKAFWNATPNGKLEMAITNPDAAETFELGKTYYLTFEPAD